MSEYTHTSLELLAGELESTRDLLKTAMETVRIQKAAMAEERAQAAQVRADLQTMLDVFDQISALTQGSVAKAVKYLYKPQALASTVAPAHAVMERYKAQS